jgi:hypothetical protein
MWLVLLRLPERLTIAGAFRRHRAPESVCLIMVAALRSQDRQVPTGQMGVDSQVDAPKLLGAFERQDSPPAIFGDRTGRWDSESGGVACPSIRSLADERKGHQADYRTRRRSARYPAFDDDVGVSCGRRLAGDPADRLVEEPLPVAINAPADAFVHAEKCPLFGMNARTN